MKKLLFGLLFLPTFGFCGSLVIDSGSGTGSLVINANAPSVVYPATATASFPYGLSASTMTVSSNTIFSGTTFYQNAPALISSATVGMLNNALVRYRRPVLQYSAGTQVNLETGNNGTSGSSIVIFPDGSVYTEATSGLLNCVITSTAIFGNGGMVAGLRQTEKLAANTWEAFYAVKSTATGNTSDFVVVMSSWMPLQANFTTLNTNFGTNGWVYLGLLPYGDNSGATTVIPNFKMSANFISFNNALTMASGNSVSGVRLATTAGATSLTWTYGSGTALGSGQVPSQVVMGTIVTGQASSTSHQVTDAAATFSYALGTGTTAGSKIILITSITITQGIKVFSSGSTATDVALNGYMDQVLGEGSLSQL